MSVGSTLQRLTVAVGVHGVAGFAAQLPVGERVCQAESRSVCIEDKTSQSLSYKPLFTDLTGDASEMVQHFTRKINLSSRGWTTPDELRYDDLVTKESLGTIKAAEVSELEQLQRHRRKTESPATGEEILERFRRARRQKSLMDKVARHVRIQAFTQDHSQGVAT